MSVLEECKQAGFSLVELLIVLALISIVLTLTIPSYNTISLSTEENIMSTQLLRAIHLAQTEAMMRQQLVTLKKLSGGWQQGYEIVTNEKGIQTRIIHDVPEELRANITLYVSSGTVKITFDEVGKMQMDEGFNSQTRISEEAISVIEKAAAVVIEEYWSDYQEHAGKYKNQYPSFVFKKPVIYKHLVGSGIYGISILYWPSRMGGAGTLSSEKDASGNYVEKDGRTLALEKLEAKIKETNSHFFSKYTMREAGVTTIDIRRRNTGKDHAIEE